MTDPREDEWAEFDLLVSGRGAPARLELLRLIRLNAHLLLLYDVKKAAPVGSTDVGERLLGEVQVNAPEAYAEALGDPHFGAWAARVLRGTPQWTDFAHLSSIAAAAALRAGMPFQVPVQPGLVVLPGLGLASTSGTLDQHTEITVPVRTLRAAHEVRLDDLNPYRHLPDDRATDRLDDRTAQQWQALFADAWRFLPADQAAEISGLVTTLVPLVQHDNSLVRSASWRDARGAVALTRPPDSRTFAATLVHETRHSVLNIIMVRHDLYDLDDDTWYYSPWRDDPRPVWGLVHGVFAFVGVAQFWRAQPSEHGAAKFAEIVVQLRHALDVLRHAALTEKGRHLIATIESTVDSWGGVEPVGADRARLEEHLDTWRSRYPNLVSPSAR